MRVRRSEGVLRTQAIDRSLGLGFGCSRSLLGGIELLTQIISLADERSQFGVSVDVPCIVGRQTRDGLAVVLERDQQRSVRCLDRF